MGRKLLWINLVLLVAVLLLGNLVFDEWRSYEVKNNVARIRVTTPPSTKGTTAIPASTTQASHLQAAGNYNVLFEKNLFSPNRREIEPPEPEVTAPKIPPMPGQPVMTGVSLIGDKKVAYIQEPGQGPKTVQVGDTIMNFGRVTEIRDDGLVYTWGEMTHNVTLQERQAAVRGPLVQRMTATVIKIGSSGKKGAGSPSMPPPAAGGAAPVGPTIQVSTVGGGANTAGMVNPQAGNANGSRLGASRGNPGLSNSQGGQLYPNQGLSNQQPNSGYVDTPFGRIARPPRRNQ